MTWGLVCPPGIYVKITWGPNQAFLTPLVTECSHISLQNPGLGGTLGEEGPREGEGLPNSGRQQAFTNFWNNGDPHHLQVLLLRKDSGPEHVSQKPGAPRWPWPLPTTATGEASTAAVSSSHISRMERTTAATGKR